MPTVLTFTHDSLGLAFDARRIPVVTCIDAANACPSFLPQDDALEEHCTANMVLEEAATNGYSSSDGQYTTGDNVSSFPSSMGPGARRADSGAMGPNQIQQSQPEFSEKGEQSPGSLLQQVQEIRSHYSFEVRDRILFLGYDIRGAARRHSLPFASMPLSGATSWLLYGGPLRSRVTSTFVIDTIRGAENLANRPLSQKEAEGYALHASRRTLYSFAS